MAPCGVWRAMSLNWLANIGNQKVVFDTRAGNADRIHFLERICTDEGIAHLAADDDQGERWFQTALGPSEKKTIGAIWWQTGRIKVFCLRPVCLQDRWSAERQAACSILRLVSDGLNLSFTIQ